MPSNPNAIFGDSQIDGLINGLSARRCANLLAALSLGHQQPENTASYRLALLLLRRITLSRVTNDPEFVFELYVFLSEHEIKEAHFLMIVGLRNLNGETNRALQHRIMDAC